MPSNRIRPWGNLMPPGLFGSTTIDCSACMEKTNTRGTAGATGVVVALGPVSKMAAASGLRHVATVRLGSATSRHSATNEARAILTDRASDFPTTGLLRGFAGVLRTAIVRHMRNAVRGRQAGVWDQIMDALTATHDAAVQMIDTSIVRVTWSSGPLTRSSNVGISQPDMTNS